MQRHPSLCSNFKRGVARWSVESSRPYSYKCADGLWSKIEKAQVRKKKAAAQFQHL